MKLLLFVLLSLCLVFATKDPLHEEDHHGWLEEDLVKNEERFILKPELSGMNSSEQIWLANNNVANVLGIQPVKQIAIPIYFNLIFVGFDGDGNDGIELLNENFEEWFEHITHQLPHITVPVGEEQTTVKKVKLKETKLKYIYSINLIKLHPIVNTVLEDILFWGVRDEYNTYCKK